MHFLYPIDIRPGKNTIRWREGSGTLSLSLLPGVYYAHNEGLGTTIGDRWPSIYAYILSWLNQYGANTYEISAAKGSKLSGVPGSLDLSGIKITRVSGTENAWGLDTDISTFDVRLLGFNPGEGYKAAVSDVLEGDFSRWGAWQPPAYALPKIGGDARQTQTRNGARENGVLTRWGTDEIRTLQWGWLPAGFVRRNVTDRPDFAAASRMPVGDHGNYFFDLWAQGISTYRDILRVDGAGFSVSSHPFEVLRSLPGSQYADELSSCLSERSEAAETYRVEVALGRIAADDPDYWGGGLAPPSYIRGL